MNYRVELVPDDNGTFLVTCPTLPEVTTFGETVEDALENAGNAIEEALAARMEEFRPVPEPDVVAAGAYSARVRLPIAVKVILHHSLVKSGWTRADLTRALGWHRTQIDRLFNPRHASRLDQVDAALAALNQRVEVHTR
jgi:antitoxin HicB